MMNLGKFEDETPLSLGENNKRSNHHSITPEYSIEQLLGNDKKKASEKTKIKSNDYAQREREKKKRRRDYIVAVSEGTNGGENINNNAENSDERGNEAEASTNNKERICSVSEPRFQ